MEFFFLLFLVLLQGTIVFSECKWNGAPKVEQIDVVTVRVSWQGVLENEDCAEKFFIKYWKDYDPSEYKLSDYFSPETKSYTLNDIRMNEPYTYQIIGTYKNWLGGSVLDRNPNKARFETNRFKEEVYQDDPLPRNNDESTEDGITGEVKTIDKTEHESTRKPEDDGKTESLILGHTLEGFVGIIGIIVGTLIGLTVAIGIVYNCLRNRKSKRDLENDFQSESEDEGSDNDEDEEKAKPNNYDMNLDAAYKKGTSSSSLNRSMSSP